MDAFGRPTMGANDALGITRSGVQPGDLTIYGPAVQSQREGIAGLFENTMLGSLMPKQARIPGYDTGILVPELGLGGPQPGEGVDPAQRFGAQSAVDYSDMGNELLGINAPRVDERLTPMSFPGNVDDLGNELGAFPEPEDRFAFEDRKGQRQAAARPPETVAEILMQEPPAASITVDRPRVHCPICDTSFTEESAPSVVFPESEDILSPERIAEILELPGRDPNAPAPFDMIGALSPSLPPAPPAQPSGSQTLFSSCPMDGLLIRET